MTPFLKCLKKGGIAVVEYSNILCLSFEGISSKHERDSMKCVAKSNVLYFVNFKHTKQPPNGPPN